MTLNLSLLNLTQEALQAMQNLEKVFKRNNLGKFMNGIMKDFESFSVESLLGGNAGNAGLGKSSEIKELRKISKTFNERV